MFCGLVSLQMMGLPRSPPPVSSNCSVRFPTAQCGIEFGSDHFSSHWFDNSCKMCRAKENTLTVIAMPCAAKQCKHHLHAYVCVKLCVYVCVCLDILVHLVQAVM